MGRLLIGMGMALLVAGLLVSLLERGGGAGFRLPGDLEFGGRGWRVSAPLATSLLISLLLTIALNLVLWIARRR